jgi:hypothetical protein
MGNCCIKPTENIEPSRTGTTDKSIETSENKKTNIEKILDNITSPDQDDFVHV